MVLQPDFRIGGPAIRMRAGMDLISIGGRHAAGRSLNELLPYGGVHH